MAPKTYNTDDLEKGDQPLTYHSLVRILRSAKDKNPPPEILKTIDLLLVSTLEDLTLAAKLRAEMMAEIPTCSMSELRAVASVLLQMRTPDAKPE